MASALLFTAVFIMIGGMQIISTRVLDGRRTLVIGMGIMSFVAVSVYPAAFTSAPAWAQPLVTSPLVLATLVALTLNLVFRIGIRRTRDDDGRSRQPEREGHHQLHRAQCRHLGRAARRHQPARIRRAADGRGRGRVRQCQRADQGRDQLRRVRDRGGDQLYRPAAAVSRDARRRRTSSWRPRTGRCG